MADFIDREELIEQLREKIQDNPISNIWNCAINCAYKIIKTQPTANTERHAHWINTTAPDEQKIHSIFQCSNCYNSIEFGEPLSNPFEYDEADYCYCGKCGCRMNEVKEQ